MIKDYAKANKIESGQVIVYYGNGKGKTTAALGLALRAAGYGKKILVLQFIKGSWPSGEQISIPRLMPTVTIRPAGKGFIGILDDKSPKSTHRAAAHAGLHEAREALEKKRFDVIILDELLDTIDHDLVEEAEIITLIKSKPTQTDLVITGHTKYPRILAHADLVTEMKNIKHPFDKGILARRGIDF